MTRNEWMTPFRMDDLEWSTVTGWVSHALWYTAVFSLLCGMCKSRFPVRPPGWLWMRHRTLFLAEKPSEAFLQHIFHVTYVLSASCASHARHGDMRCEWIVHSLRPPNAELGLMIPTGIVCAPNIYQYTELHGYHEEDTQESGTSLVISLKNFICT